MSVSIRRVNYKGWPNSYRLTNGVIELIVTTDVGPRVIRFGFVGEGNEFKEYEAQLGKRGGKSWRVYGGHRLWHAPEEEPRTYFPDNAPVKLERYGGGIRLVQSVETTTGIQKELDVRLAPNHTRVEIVHRLRNTNAWSIDLAPWALTVMAQGGTAILPLPPRGPHPENLSPSNSLTLWKYTDMSDPRWCWGRKYILLRQDSSPSVQPQKLGAMVPNGWAAYARNGHLFVKTFDYTKNAPYADQGCNFEMFTNREMLEVESLGPLTTLAPGVAVDHVEHWWLFRDVPVPRHESDVDAMVLPRIRTISRPRAP
jgi:hypothetical protein